MQKITMKSYKVLAIVPAIFILFSCTTQPEVLSQQPVVASQMVVSLSENSLVTMRLAVQEGVRGGKVSQEVSECVSLLKPSVFNSVFEPYVNKQFSVAEKAEVEAFLKTSLGVKFSKYALLELSSLKGLPLSEPVPSFSEEEMYILEQFGKTPAGNKWFRNKAIQQQSGMIFQSRFKELLFSCGYVSANGQDGSIKEGM